MIIFSKNMRKKVLVTSIIGVCCGVFFLFAFELHSTVIGGYAASVIDGSFFIRDSEDNELVEINQFHWALNKIISGLGMLFFLVFGPLLFLSIFIFDILPRILRF